MIEFFEHEFNKLSVGQAPDYVNMRIRKWLSSAPVVYSYETEIWWGRTRAETDTHQARLVCIEELKPKECIHEPDSKEGLTRGPGVMVFSTKCKHCGVKLKAKWEAEG